MITDEVKRLFEPWGEVVFLHTETEVYLDHYTLGTGRIESVPNARFSVLYATFSDGKMLRFEAKEVMK